MISIENEIFTAIKKAVSVKHPKCYFSGIEERLPSAFPCVFVEEASNAVYRNTRDSSNVENYAQILYSVDVYSNKSARRKEEAKAIMSIIDDMLGNLGLTRTMLMPVANADTSIYRLRAQYRAIVSKDKVIYRR